MAGSLGEQEDGEKWLTDNTPLEVNGQASVIVWLSHVTEREVKDDPWYHHSLGSWYHFG